MDEEFVEIYGNVGYFLRKNNLNTPGRISMLTALVYLQSESERPVNFDKFYELALERTGEKLEKSSFKTFVKKLQEEIGGHKIIHEEDRSSKTHFKCSSGLMEEIEKSGREFSEEYLS